jgi:uncharacterized protein YbjT (DUF2867 family)
MSGKVLVCGAGGTVGRAVLSALRRRGVPAAALVRSDAAEERLRGSADEFRRADMADAEATRMALTGVESVFLLTKPAPTQLALEANMLEQIRAAGVERVVRVSVIGADPDADSPVRRWHGAAERQLETSELQAVNLRANFFMQNFLAMRGAIESKGRFSLPLGEAGVSMVDVADIAQAAARLLAGDVPWSPRRPIDLTGPEALPMSEVARLIGIVWRCDCAYSDLPIDRFEASMMKSGSPAWLARALAGLYQEMQQGRNGFVNETLADVLGRPPGSFGAFLDRHVSR